MKRVLALLGLPGALTWMVLISVSMLLPACRRAPGPTLLPGAGVTVSSGPTRTSTLTATGLLFSVLG